jgi:hypothetical protein
MNSGDFMSGLFSARSSGAQSASTANTMGLHRGQTDRAEHPDESDDQSDRAQPASRPWWTATSPAAAMRTRMNTRTPIACGGDHASDSRTTSSTGRSKMLGCHGVGAATMNPAHRQRTADARNEIGRTFMSSWHSRCFRAVAGDPPPEAHHKHPDARQQVRR